jgi:hypothetical protein
VESVALAASVTIAVVSLTRCLHRRHWQPWTWFGAGLVAIAIGRVALEDLAWIETPLVVAGALCIATAHVVNRRLCCAVGTGRRA